MGRGKPEELSEKGSLNQASPHHKHQKITFITLLTSAEIAFNFLTLC